MIPIVGCVIQAALVVYLAYQGLIVPALLVVLVAELWRDVRHLGWRVLTKRAVPIVVGASVVVIIALLPKALAQLGLAAGYAAWLSWGRLRPAAAPISFGELLGVQALALEALFLAAAIWQVARPVVMLLVWAVLYATSYQALAARAERAAAALAAAWALVAAQVSWVSLAWLVSYVTPGHYAIVPQPVLVLTAVGYCFGSIYLAQKHGELGRSRFAEYLLIGFVLLWVVVAGTHWKGSL